jgi:nucleotide-binding universal stress UspA family protein
VNISSMLRRLGGTLGCADLAGQMLLLASDSAIAVTKHASINLVVGYNGSAHSQMALDLTLWIAHQTRLATPKPVTVQAVYVLDWESSCQISTRYGVLESAGSRQGEWESQEAAGFGRAAVLEVPCQLTEFDHADRILWQARTLAEEWRGSLNTHLRFGVVAHELRQVVEAEAAALLVLGCYSAANPLVQALGASFPCPVVGLPSQIID